jgi:hypothetical protein
LPKLRVGGAVVPDTTHSRGVDDRARVEVEETGQQETGTVGDGEGKQAGRGQRRLELKVVLSDPVNNLWNWLVSRAHRRNAYRVYLRQRIAKNVINPASSENLLL